MEQKQTTLEASIADLQALGFTNKYIVKSLKTGINDCQRFIDRESGRDAALRPEKTQQHLDYCISHKQKLLVAIEGLIGSAQ